jgi:hypothetical protein
MLWALISRSYRETVEIYFDRAQAASRGRARDVPEWVGELDVIALRWIEGPCSVCLN